MPKNLGAVRLASAVTERKPFANSERKSFATESKRALNCAIASTILLFIPAMLASTLESLSRKRLLLSRKRLNSCCETKPLSVAAVSCILGAGAGCGKVLLLVAAPASTPSPVLLSLPALLFADLF